MLHKMSDRTNIGNYYMKCHIKMLLVTISRKLDERFLQYFLLAW